MSIIYQALKKIEEKQDQTKRPKLRNKIIYLVSFVVVLFSVCILWAYVSRISRASFVKRSALSSNQKVDLGEKPIVRGRKDILLYKEQQEKAKKALSLQKDSKIKQGATQYYLQGIIYTPENPIALINGQRLSQGESVDAATVIKISPKSVELKTKEDVIYLTLE